MKDRLIKIAKWLINGPWLVLIMIVLGAMLILQFFPNTNTDFAGPVTGKVIASEAYEVWNSEAESWQKNYKAWVEYPVEGDPGTRSALIDTGAVEHEEGAEIVLYYNTDNPGKTVRATDPVASPKVLIAGVILIVIGIILLIPGKRKGMPQ